MELDEAAAAATDSPSKRARPQAAQAMRLCRVCKRAFDPSKERDVCVTHSGHFSGETAQRWLDPGESAGIGHVVHFFWSCCGQADADAPGCLVARHASYDDDDNSNNDDAA